MLWMISTTSSWHYSAADHPPNPSWTTLGAVNRYANLFIHGLAPDHYIDFPDRLSRIDLDALNDALHRQIHPDALVAVVVADAAEAVEPLNRLDWAELEIIED